MGKIRIKTLGDALQEQEQRKKSKEKREGKLARVQSSSGRRLAKAPGLKGGERVVSVGQSIEEIEKQQVAEKLSGAKDLEGGKKAKKVRQKIKSKRFTQNASIVKNSSLYRLDTAIELLKKFAKTKFDETVELHLNVKEKGISGQVSLPHGTGKKLRIKVADDALVSQIEQGKIDFDILIAEPAMMPKLAKVARILGPRGLMPNPKNGTISDKPAEVMKKFESGQISFKTEAAAPIIHLSAGKLSFAEKQIEENVGAIISAIGASKIENVTLKSTMSPAIKLDISTFEKSVKK